MFHARWPPIFTLLCLLFTATIRANAQASNAPDPRTFQNFDVALQNSKENMCPFLVLDGSRLPIVCWLCRFPYGMQQDNRYVYDCCSGYERSKDAQNRCIQVESSWRTMVDYVKHKGNTKTADALATNTGIADLDADPSLGVYTAFIPRNDDDVQTGETDYTGRDNSARMMVAKGRWYSKGFTNRRTIKNENSVDMKITTYSNGLTFLECRLVRSVDHETMNGVVHFLDGSIPATHLYPTVLSRLEADSDLSEFVQSLPRDLREDLGRPDSYTWYTVFAPTNRAWKEAVRALEPGESVQTLARQHVLDRMICARSVIEESRNIGPTKAEDFFKLTRNSDGATAVLDVCNRNIPLIRQDLMSGTGVVHVIDNAITTLRALNKDDALSCLGRNPTLGVEQALREMTECDTTAGSKANVILLPNQDAYRWMNSNENQGKFSQIHSDRAYKCNLYAHQMLTSSSPGVADPGNRGFAQGQKFSTDYKAKNGEIPTVITSYSQDPDGSSLHFGAAIATVKEPMRYRDGQIYVVKTVNPPPGKTMLEIIQSEPNLKEISSKLAQTGMQQDFARMNGNVLFLAPMDMGWRTRELENAYDKKQTRKLLQLHTIPHALLGGRTGFVGYATMQSTDSLLSEKGNGKVKLIMKRNPDGNMFIGHSELPENLWAMVLKWNLVGTDGVVWVIDWPIKCPAFTC